MINKLKNNLKKTIAGKIFIAGVLKTYLKEVQENYIENDLFRVILGLFIMSVSFLTVSMIPEEFTEDLNRADIGVNILLVFLTGIGITISGLVPIIMSVIHKVLKAVWDSKWYVSIMLPAFFMSLIISLVSLDVNATLLYIFAKAVLIFCVVWLMFYITLKIASLDIDKGFKNIPVKKINLKKTHRQKNKVNRLNRKKGRI